MPSRRHFLKASFATAASLAIPIRSWAQVDGANNDIRVAIVGFNGRGKSHIDAFGNMPGVRITALCDVDKTVLGREVKKFGDKGISVEGYQDIRKLLENRNVDAIAVATPNHWHSLAAIWAIQAGKDVYVEKPVSHNVWEGRKVVEAARRHSKIVQTGTQSRSRRDLPEAFAWLRAGNLGKIKIARGLCYKPRPSIGKVDAPTPIPESIDYDLWCGPAPKTPLMRKRLHYDWHWVWPTGNGDLGNQGIHQMDVARWALGKSTLSPKVFSVGGRLSYVDDGETPNTQFVVHDYGDCQLIFEVRGLPSKADSRDMDSYKGQKIKVVVECEGGYLSDATAYDHSGKLIKKFAGKKGDDEEGGSHQANFIKAMRTRRHTDLNADILQGHLSSALCHTGNISYRLGKQTLGRFEEHLKANLVDLDKTKATLGAFLRMNPQTERFIDNDAANQLLTREYRAPYVVPERV
jgi:predicted dehydrogenase